MAAASYSPILSGGPNVARHHFVSLALLVAGIGSTAAQVDRPGPLRGLTIGVFIEDHMKMGIETALKAELEKSGAAFVEVLRGTRSNLRTEVLYRQQVDKERAEGIATVAKEVLRRDCGLGDEPELPVRLGEGGGVFGFALRINVLNC